VTGLEHLPADLPVPADDGAAAHLPGRLLPAMALPATDGSSVELDRLPGPRAVLYLYPMTGRPDVGLPDGWDAIPGARGCTPQARDFRDHHGALLAAGAGAVHGLSSQSTADQREAVERLDLPFPLLSDVGLLLATALDLPTFTAGGRRLFRRITLVVSQGRVEHVFYPVHPPDGHAGEVLSWLRSTATPGSGVGPSLIVDCPHPRSSPW
jgi:peroxiredoxin